jgi:vacuolar-type H+-ATPase subunit B/Vma2
MIGLIFNNSICFVVGSYGKLGFFPFIIIYNDFIGRIHFLLFFISSNLIFYSKSYRQISLILGKIPSRDAYPADIFNIHSSLLERCGKLKYSYFGGSITSLPIIETINSDITEYIATNVKIGIINNVKIIKVIKTRTKLIN